MPGMTLQTLGGAALIFLSYYVVFAGGLYANSGSSFAENLQGVATLFSQGGGDPYFTYIIATFILFLIGANTLGWNNCESFTVEEGVFSAPGTFVQKEPFYAENFAGGINNLQKESEFSGFNDQAIGQS